MKKISHLLKRVDTQVSLFVAAVVAVFTVIAYLLQYSFTYADTIHSLHERVDSIYEYLDDRLDNSTFSTITEPDDINTPEYLEMHRLFDTIRQVTGVMYLYTARQDENMDFVYVIDGLDPENPDFRYPGDLIEPEIYDDMNQALRGEAVLPDEIKDTEWGKIFIGYLPIYDHDTVVGVIGIEFEAEHSYVTYQSLRILAPALLVLFSILASLVARTLFRQISNPSFQTMANTDFLTGLKNRNAYQLDLDNMIARDLQKDVGIAVMDLNNLKWINDTYGHEAGDNYILCIAEAYRNLGEQAAILYRTGGDEFVLVHPDATSKSLNDLVFALAAEFQKMVSFPEQSFSWGIAIYDSHEDEDLNSTYRRADKHMYAKKQDFYKHKTE